MLAVPVARQVERQDPEAVAEGGRHVGPPVGVGAAPVDEDEAPGPRWTAGQCVDGRPVDLHLEVVQGDGQRPPEPLGGVRQRLVGVHLQITAHRGGTLGPDDGRSTSGRTGHPDRGPGQAVRRRRRPGRARPRGGRGGGGRLPGPERGREDHHAPAPARADPPDRRPGVPLRPGLPEPARRGPPPARLRAGRGQPLAVADRGGDAPPAGPGPGPCRRRLPGRAGPPVRPRPHQEGACLLEGQPAEAGPDRRAHGPSRPAAARRAHQRPRPPDGAGLPALHPRGP